MSGGRAFTVWLEVKPAKSKTIALDFAIFSMAYFCTEKSSNGSRMTFISDIVHRASEREAAVFIPFEWNRIVERLASSSNATQSGKQSFLL